MRLRQFWRGMAAADFSSSKVEAEDRVNPDFSDQAIGEYVEALHRPTLNHEPGVEGSQQGFVLRHQNPAFVIR